MNEDTFLYDTYALIEILNKNINYEKFTETGLVINDFIFAELCFKLFREGVNVNEYIAEVSPAIIHATPKIIIRAMLFIIDNKDKNLSMTDCISYIQSKELGIKFLTGDKQFENLENVEFVKK
ncbi:PIN domain-containing protein [Candidatus Woesearchaeota archaeon]|nr:PIN domain-containing protein [Candidatus Woesearchaeota archaeon]